MTTRAGIMWMWTPVVILTATVVFGAWRMHVALDDPHFGTVEHPYEDGEHWDQHQAALAARNALGWQAELSAAPEGGLLLTIHDAQGAALLGVRGELSGFHNGFPQDILAVPLEELGDGRYLARVAPHRPGLWRWHARTDALTADAAPWFEDFKLHVDAEVGK